MGVAKGCCACVKYFLFLFNTLFFLVGLGLVGIGIYALVHNSSDIAVIIDNTEGTFGGLVIAVGALTCLLSAAGCCGAVKEHKASLLCYAIALSFVLVLELAAGGVGYHYRNKLKSVVDGGMKKTLNLYDPKAPSSNIHKAWDEVQKLFKCCGVDTPLDWTSNDSKWGREMPKDQFPASCCHKPSGQICRNSTDLEFRDRGCLSHVQLNLSSKWGILAGVAIAVPCIQLFGIICACCLRRHLVNEGDYYRV